MRTESVSIVIPLDHGSRWNNTELRYCLRSIEKHLHGCGDIFIIGECPEWIRNVIHIPATDGDKTYEKERNIFHKIMIACRDEMVTEDFYFTNDDHFLLQDFDAASFPYHYTGLLHEEALRTDPYRQTIENTIKFFPNIDYNFDTHCPIVYNKERFIATVGAADWSVKWGYGIKSLYCGLNGIPGEYYPDLKIRENLASGKIKELIAGRPYFSMDDKAREGGMLKVLQELYPKKSKHEK